MSAKSGILMVNITDDPRVRFGLWIAGIVAVLGIIGWLLSAPSAAPDPTLPPDPFTDPSKAMARYRAIAHQTGGSWNRINSTDQMILNKMTYGHGREYFTRISHEPLPASPSSSATP